MAYWIAEGRGADGAVIKRKVPYTDGYNTQKEEETIHALEEWIINTCEEKYGGCEWYSVSFQPEEE